MARYVEACLKYIREKDCYYLAKEDIVVYYATDTGRPQDAKWQSLTMAQAYRVVRAIYASGSFDSAYMLQAFQEEGRVYEYGIKSKHKVRDGVFNYNEHGRESMLDEVLGSIARELINEHYMAFLMGDFHQVAGEILRELKLDDEGTREAKVNALEAEGYRVRADADRPRHFGQLVTCAVMSGYKPKDIRRINKLDEAKIINAVLKEFR
jgi:hypothetical protein